ncbi:MAG TPA: futalosine hydrolase [Flavisolibacter sp.]|nr:futalosine hydrolase [Flavisolibacter sp.]
MRIVLCAATEFEISPILDFIKKQQFPDINVVFTGVGLTAATYHITKAIYKHNPQIILQAGVAGSFNANNEGQVVVVKSECLGDLGVEEKGTFHSVFTMGLQQADDYPWSNSKLVNTDKNLPEWGLPVVDAVTVHEISTDPKRIQYYRDQLQASIETMEGAALHYVSLMEKFPFLQLRSVSNFAGERDKSKWQLKLAIEKLNYELEKILLKLMK